MTSENDGRFTWKSLSTILVCAAFLFLNFDGYSPLGMQYPPTEAPDWATFFSEPPSSPYSELSIDVQRAFGRTEPTVKSRSWVHGWPFFFAARSPTYSISAGIGVEKTSMLAGDMAYTSRWPTDGAHVFFYSNHLLLLNISIGLALALAVWWATPSRPVRLRFSLMHALTLIAIAAVFVRFKLVNLRFGPQILAILVIVTSVTLLLAISIYRIKQRLRSAG